MAAVMLPAIVLTVKAQSASVDGARYLDTDLSFEERAADLQSLTVQLK